MFMILPCVVLLPLVAKGSRETLCAAMDENQLQCKFPENINFTRKDFGVYFLPETGGEEKLVDCAWINEQLHCIRQEGFECKQPVSDNAVIAVPIRFLNRTGTYRCSLNGYRPETSSSCRFPAKKDKEVFADCEAEGSIEKSQVTLNCKFSSRVESFSIKQNKTVVASFKKSDCQSATVCLYQPGDNDDIFTVQQKAENVPREEYMCLPDSPSLQLQVKRCSVHKDNTEQTEKSTFPVVAVVLSAICGLTLVAAATVVVIIRRQRRLKLQRQREVEDRQEIEPL